MSSGTRTSYLEHVFEVVSYTIHYWRGFEKFMNKNGQTYLRGQMAVRDISTADYVWFDTIERTDGTPWLRPSTYRATMEISTDAKNPGRRQIRPTHSQRNTDNKICNFLIHASAPPHFLTGCIAPGIDDPLGIKESDKAMERIFKCLGGFRAGKQVYLRVDGTRPAK